MRVARGVDNVGPGQRALLRRERRRRRLHVGVPDAQRGVESQARAARAEVRREALHARASDGKNQREKEMKLSLVMNVDYKLNGCSRSRLEECLLNAARFLFDNGLLSGEVVADVKKWDASVVPTEDVLVLRELKDLPRRGDDDMEQDHRCITVWQDKENPTDLGADASSRWYVREDFSDPERHQLVRWASLEGTAPARAVRRELRGKD